MLLPQLYSIYSSLGIKIDLEGVNLLAHATDMCLNTFCRAMILVFDIGVGRICSVSVDRVGIAMNIEEVVDDETEGEDDEDVDE